MMREEAIMWLGLMKKSCILSFDKNKRDALDIAIEALSAPPTDIVYCKDCKRCESDGGALMTCEVTEMIVDDDYYCWWGERREP